VGGDFADATHEAAVHCSVAHFSILEGMPFVSYAAVGCLNLFNVVILFLDSLRMLNGIWCESDDWGLDGRTENEKNGS
jgi:hypothetical protein